MRHPRQVRDDRLALGVLAEEHRECRELLVVGVLTDELREISDRENVPILIDQGASDQFLDLLKPEALAAAIAAKRQQFERHTTALEPLLHQSSNGLEADFIWQLDDQEAVFDKARHLLNDARQSILVSLWPDAFDLLYDDLEAAVGRGAKLAVVHYGPPARRLGATFHHPAEDAVAREDERVQDRAADERP